MEKQEKKERKIITENRMATINAREMSFEGLVLQFESGEDGIYNLMTKDKNIIFKPKVAITKKDLEEIQPLRQLKEAIKTWEKALKRSKGQEAYTIKKALIEMRKDQYVIKNCYRQPITMTKMTKSRPSVKLDGYITFNAENRCVPHGITCVDPRTCEAALCNYEKLKTASYGKFRDDLWSFMQDFDHIMEKALAREPVCRIIVDGKIKGLQNREIQQELFNSLGITHTPEYISYLWRNKIPKLLASYAEEEYLQWYFTFQEKGAWKRCSRCGEIKLANSKFFSKNKTSKDGWYSLCKACRNKKKGGIVNAGKNLLL